MANPEHVEIARQGANAIATWRTEHLRARWTSSVLTSAALTCAMRASHP